MKKSSVQCVALLAVVGMACSMAAAQTSDVLPTSGASKVRSGQSKYRVLTRHEFVNPVKVEINGVEVPFTLDTGNSGTDYNVALYDNVASGPWVTDTTHRSRTLDDFTLAGGQSAEITGLRPSWATPATVSTVATIGVTVEFQFFCTMNPGSSPVNGAPATNSVRIAYGIPSGGYAANTVYTGTGFVLNTAGAQGLVVSSGGVDVRLLLTTGLTAHPDYDPTIDTGGVVAGTSTDGVWVDVNGNGTYESGEVFNGAAASDNLRLGIQGRVIPTASGACCLPDGSCVSLTNSQCTGLSGVYNGDGVTCAAVPGHCATAPVLHNNGPIITGPSTLSGVSYAGGPISEAPQEPPCASSTGGPNGSVTFRLADDFTVPAGKQWAINKLSVFAYNSPGNTSTSTITSVNVRIWNGHPGNPSSTVVFGDTATNRLTGTPQFVAYRTFNTNIGLQAPTNTRTVFRFDCGGVTTTLPAGTYWVDYQFNAASFTPLVSLMTNSSNGVRGSANANSLQLVTAPAPNPAVPVWQLVGENGAQTGCVAAQYDTPFIIEGVESNVGVACYANCDNSTATPCLNVQDFGCFLNAFSNGTSYANCDGSTNVPVLNVQDFGCFLNAFSNGCSSCV